MMFTWEDGCAKMSDPAREKQGNGGVGGIGGSQAGNTEEVADMIERHDDHDYAAKDVDGFDAGAG
jgi:hypothetical protein